MFVLIVFPPSTRCFVFIFLYTLVWLILTYTSVFNFYKFLDIVSKNFEYSEKCLRIAILGFVYEK